MKKIVALFFIIVCLYLVFSVKRENRTVSPSATQPTIKEGIRQVIRRTSVFIPYWALGQGDYTNPFHDLYYYFGVALDENGVMKSDPGYAGLALFNCPKTKKCYLVLRMLDNKINISILGDTYAQEKIIRQTLDIAEKKNFSGIALDLELSGIFSVEVMSQINSFVQSYYTSAKRNYKMFSFIAYGDNYYRKRPFDMKFIGNQADEVMIMAYDFHKSYGEPGPNFPFDRRSPSESEGGGGSDKYGYDFKQMITDFSQDIARKKLTVIYGMYGYDWTLNEQGAPLKRAEAITVNQINKIKSQMSNVKITTQKSKEKTIEYSDSGNYKHVIYYEDEESAAIKTDYLRKVGVGSVSFWAHGYY